MSDSPHLSSGDSISVGSDKLSHHHDRDNLKLGHQKCPATAPKPKPKPRKPPTPEDSVLKNLDDVLDREEGNINTDVVQLARGDDDNIPSSVRPVMDCLATIAVDNERAPYPPPDYDDVTDEEEPVVDNVVCPKALESPVKMDSETSDYRSDSRGSIGDDVPLLHTAHTGADEYVASLKETCVRSDCHGREV